MKYEIKLCVKEGGLVPARCPDFDPFWGSVRGIFHDVFEHYFEGYHKYFSGWFANTLFGEIVAAGHSMAYEEVGVNRDLGHPYREEYYNDFFYLIEDYFYCGENPVFSVEEKVCRVPAQKNIDFSGSCRDMFIDEAVYRYNEAAKKSRFKKPFSSAKLRDCYEYGYRQGKKIIGKDVKNTTRVFSSFIERWSKITNGIEGPEYYVSKDGYPLAEIIFKVSNYGVLSVKETFVFQDNSKTNKLVGYENF